MIGSLIVKQMSYDEIFLTVLTVPLFTLLLYKVHLGPEALKNLIEIIKQTEFKITNKKARKETRMDSAGDDAAAENKALRMIIRNNKYIIFYTEQIRSLRSLNDDVMPWLENLSLAPIDLRYTCKLILCAVFLYSEEPAVVRKACDILLNIGKEIKSFAPYVMCSVNHKISVFYDSASMLRLLKVFSHLGSTRVVTSTLQTMQNSERPLSDIIFELYVQAVKNNSRCYRFLSSALVQNLERNSAVNDWRTYAVCANTIKHICESQPEHGEELVPLLSLILNRCVDTNGGAASALALNSISSLCKSAVIGIFLYFKPTKHFFFYLLYSLRIVRVLINDAILLDRYLLDLAGVGAEDAHGEAHGGPGEPV